MLCSMSEVTIAITLNPTVDDINPAVPALRNIP